MEQMEGIAPLNIIVINLYNKCPVSVKCNLPHFMGGELLFNVHKVRIFIITVVTHFILLF